MDGAILRPDDVNHFMVLRDIEKRIIIRLGDLILADSTSSVRMMEAFRSLYDPVIYLPKSDVKVTLERQDKSTFCPLKGDASYYSLSDTESAGPIAWSYEDPLAGAVAIKDLVAFYSSKVSIEEHPLDLAA